MEQIKINKTYFKLQGESRFPPKNPTPTRNRVSNSGLDYANSKNMSYEEFQRMKHEEKRNQSLKEYAKAEIARKEQLSHDIQKLENIAEALQRGDFGENSPEKREAQNFVTQFKRRWYK